jgi:hypothetical protein
MTPPAHPTSRDHQLDPQGRTSNMSTEALVALTTLWIQRGEERGSSRAWAHAQSCITEIEDRDSVLGIRLTMALLVAKGRPADALAFARPHLRSYPDHLLPAAIHLATDTATRNRLLLKAADYGVGSCLSDMVHHAPAPEATTTLVEQLFTSQRARIIEAVADGETDSALLLARRAHETLGEAIDTLVHHASPAHDDIRSQRIVIRSALAELAATCSVPALRDGAAAIRIDCDERYVGQLPSYADRTHYVDHVLARSPEDTPVIRAHLRRTMQDARLRPSDEREYRRVEEAARRALDSNLDGTHEMLIEFYKGAVERTTPNLSHAAIQPGAPADLQAWVGLQLLSHCHAAFDAGVAGAAFELALLSDPPESTGYFDKALQEGDHRAHDRRFGPMKRTLENFFMPSRFEAALTMGDVLRDMDPASLERLLPNRWVDAEAMCDDAYRNRADYGACNVANLHAALHSRSHNQPEQLPADTIERVVSLYLEAAPTVGSSLHALEGWVFNSDVAGEAWAPFARFSPYAVDTDPSLCPSVLQICERFAASGTRSAVDRLAVELVGRAVDHPHTSPATLASVITWCVGTGRDTLALPVCRALLGRPDVQGTEAWRTALTASADLCHRRGDVAAADELRGTLVRHSLAGTADPLTTDSLRDWVAALDERGVAAPMHPRSITRAARRPLALLRRRRSPGPEVPSATTDQPRADRGPDPGRPGPRLPPSSWGL